MKLCFRCARRGARYAVAEARGVEDLLRESLAVRRAQHELFDVQPPLVRGVVVLDAGDVRLAVVGMGSLGMARLVLARGLHRDLPGHGPQTHPETP